MLPSNPLQSAKAEFRVRQPETGEAGFEQR